MKYEVNQHVFVFEPFVYGAVECIIEEIDKNRGVYIVDSVNGENIPTIYYERYIYTTKEQCLKQEYEIAQEQVRRNTIKMKELEKQLNALKNKETD